MAMGKYSRVDGKKSSGYGLTITAVFVVSLCLVGAWMLMSSWSAPTDSVGYSSSATAKDVEPAIKNGLTQEEGDRSTKNGGNEAVTEDKTDSQKSAEENQSSDERTEAVEEKKEFDDSNGDKGKEKEKNVTEGEGENAIRREHPKKTNLRMVMYAKRSLKRTLVKLMRARRRLKGTNIQLSTRLKLQKRRALEMVPGLHNWSSRRTRRNHNSPPYPRAKVATDGKRAM